MKAKALKYLNRIILSGLHRSSGTPLIDNRKYEILKANSKGTLPHPVFRNINLSDFPMISHTSHGILSS
jgi:hypothetical protein